MLTAPTVFGGRGDLELIALLLEVEDRGAGGEDAPVDGEGEGLARREGKARDGRLQSGDRIGTGGAGLLPMPRICAWLVRAAHPASSNAHGNKRERRKVRNKLRAIGKGVPGVGLWGGSGPPGRPVEQAMLEDDPQSQRGHRSRRPP